MTRRQKISRWSLALTLVLLLFIFIPEEAHGQISLFGFENIAFSVIGKIILGILWVVSWLGGVVVALVSWFVEVFLALNTQIVNSPAVKIGFPITLAFANLCFVLAIIVIAMATIIRFQSYGTKQALWRLIVITMLVNFGLVIAGSIMGFSDSLAMYFLKGVSPAGDSQGVKGEGTGFNSFASALSGMASPQQFLNYDPKTMSGAAGGQAMSDALSGSGIGQFLGSIGRAFFSVFALIFIIVTLGALVIMLIQRYVTMGYLLIILPIAWASFIFPHTRQYWTKWWNNFFKNVFFTPIVLFFLWLVIQIGKSMAEQDSYFQAIKPGSDGAGGVLELIVAGIAQPLLQTTVLLGLMLAGLMAAKNFGFGIANTAQTLAMGAAYGLGSWSKRKGIQGATAAANKIPVRKFADKLQSGSGFWGKGLNSLTLGGSSRLGGLMQRGMVAGTEGQVEEAGKRLGNLSNEELVNRMSRSTAAERMFIMDKLNKEGKLNDIPNLEKYLGGDSKDGENAKLWQRFNRGKTFSTLKAESGVEYHEAAKKLRDLMGETGGVPNQAQQAEIDKAKLAISESIRRIKNPANIASVLIKDADKMSDEDKLKIPGLTENSSPAQIREIQKEFIGDMIQNASGAAYGKMISGLESGQQVEAFKAIAQSAMSDISPEAYTKTGAAVWSKSSAARSLGYSEPGWLGRNAQETRERGGSGGEGGRFNGPTSTTLPDGTVITRNS